MGEYCNGEDRNSVYFVSKGGEVNETYTPKSIGFVEGDTVEVCDA